MRRRLISLQRPFLLLITRAYRTTSSSALQVLSGVPPLDLSVERESMLANVLRLRHSFSLWGMTYNPSDYTHHYSTFICSPSEYDLPLRISHNSSNLPSTDFSIFTDGSRIDEGTGCGLCVYSQQTLQFSWKRSLGPANSVYQSELFALRKAVRLAASFLPLTSSIFSDSASSLQSLLQLPSRNPLVREIQIDLQSIPVTDRPWMAWIPAHVGIVGNETEDQLAKEAASLSHRSLSSLPAPPSFLKRASYNSLLSIWQGRWDSDVVGRRTYSFLPRVSFSLQTSTSYLTWFLTGHGPFPSYLNRFNLRPSAHCPCGGTGDPDHFVYSCPLTSHFHLQPISTVNLRHFVSQVHHNKNFSNRLSHLMRFCQNTFSYF
ncbi:uncharacterized protein LOC118199407 [Stegodyphus dumicola]|uniref:uncharacterized protein LOC118199407 n=1 Tax=Stegodyphus dumicola TaxID=202533 RepID=UPI0015A8297C|nr:uncharacterized protein LOC118199407 [Stegodyphus dumicola]